VKVGVLDKGLRVVLEGLSPSDRLVVNGLQRARPGAQVRPKAEEIGADAAERSGSAERPGPPSPAR